MLVARKAQLEEQKEQQLGAANAAHGAALEIERILGIMDDTLIPVEIVSSDSPRPHAVAPGPAEPTPSEGRAETDDEK